MTERKCDCLECRVRAALSEDNNPDAPFAVDVNEASKALGNILGELLAHHTSKSAKSFAAALLEQRKLWLKHPRVAAQQKPAGHA